MSVISDQQPPTLTVHDPERAHHIMMLEFGSRTQFDDSGLEYRRLFSELLGTFFGSPLHLGVRQTSRFRGIAW